MRKYIPNILAWGAIIALTTGTAVWSTLNKEAALDRVAESNRLVAEETRELTEAIHENNQLLELVEGTGPKTQRLN